MGIMGKLKEMNCIVDNSVYGLDEIEKHGKIDEVLKNIVFVLNELFKNMGLMESEI
jgi:hypothetical protein